MNTSYVTCRLYHVVRRVSRGLSDLFRAIIDLWVFLDEALDDGEELLVVGTLVHVWADVPQFVATSVLEIVEVCRVTNLLEQRVSLTILGENDLLRPLEESPERVGAVRLNSCAEYVVAQVLELPCERDGTIVALVAYDKDLHVSRLHSS